MNREFRFFVYLLERYAARNGETADMTYNRLAAHGLVDYALGMYELYHVESLENAFADLDRKMSLPAHHVKKGISFIMTGDNCVPAMRPAGRTRGRQGSWS